MQSTANGVAYKALLQYQSTGNALQEIIMGNFRFQIPVNIRGKQMYVPTAFPVGIFK